MEKICAEIFIWNWISCARKIVNNIIEQVVMEHHIAHSRSHTRVKYFMRIVRRCHAPKMVEQVSVMRMLQRLCHVNNQIMNETAHNFMKTTFYRVIYFE